MRIQIRDLVNPGSVLGKSPIQFRLRSTVYTNIFSILRILVSDYIIVPVTFVPPPPSPNRFRFYSYGPDLLFSRVTFKIYKI
jgi:hypothetical protein